MGIRSQIYRKGKGIKDFKLLIRIEPFHYKSYQPVHMNGFRIFE